MKKLWKILFVACLISVLSACGNTSVKQDENTYSYPYEDEVINGYDITDNTDSQPLYSSNNDGLLFTTEYTIVDYVENAIIVSKNNGLLYGVLDNNGNEVIPVKYDNIKFANKANYVEEKNENIYFIAKYESEYIIFDANGNELFRSKNPLEYINCFSGDDAPFFKEIPPGNDEIFYNEKLEHIGTATKNKSSEDKAGDIQAISDICYMYREHDVISYYHCYSDIYILDYNKNIINKFEGYQSAERSYGGFLGVFTDDEYILPLVNTSGGHPSFFPTDYTVFHIDKNGNTISKENMTVNEYQDKYLYSNTDEKYNLYSSNSTWKLEDLNGNPLLDERYYDKIDAIGENDCILLANENNEVCLFSRQGILYIDYGVLTYNNETLKMLTFNSSEKVDYIYEGKESIIIPIVSPTTSYYDIYYFSGK